LAFTARIDEDEVFKDLSNFFIVRGEQEPADSHRAQSSTPSKYRSPVAHVLDEIPQDQSYLFTAKEPQQPEVPQEAKEERINEEQKSWVCMITDVGRLVGDCVSIRREMHESLKELERKLDDLNRRRQLRASESATSLLICRPPLVLGVVGGGCGMMHRKRVEVTNLLTIVA
jgi:hypothetical protein